MKRTKKETRELYDEAFRYRAGLVGMLQICLCGFPLEQAATATGHEDFCPAHRYYVNSNTRAPSITMPTPAPGPLCPSCGFPTNVVGANCPDCQPALAIGGGR